jgi:hypothetical protein
MHIDHERVETHIELTDPKIHSALSSTLCPQSDFSFINHGRIIYLIKSVSPCGVLNWGGISRPASEIFSLSISRSMTPRQTALM